jgi:hypothetical protein
LTLKLGKPNLSFVLWSDALNKQFADFRVGLGAGLVVAIALAVLHSSAPEQRPESSALVGFVEGSVQ